jgi:hypothetical protein
MKKWQKLTDKNHSPLDALKYLSLDSRIRATVKNYYEPVTVVEQIKLSPRLKEKLKNHL